MEKPISIQKDFDAMLGGGLIPGNITHIYGPPASGKTNIAIIATRNAAKEGTVIYIDPEGGFSVERMKQIAGEDFDAVLKNLLLIEPTDYDEQKVAIKKLDELVPKTNAKLVIVDSIAVLYRLEEEKDIKELGRQLAQLLRVARKFHIPVLITNQVYTDINTQKIVPVGGDILRYWAKIVIALEKVNGIRAAVLEKHKFVKEGIRLEFKIRNEGLETLGLYHASPS